MSVQASIARRGWCPGVRRPMATGDGLLVRLQPFGGRLTAHQARLVAQAAREYGNGHLDVTARGNLQIRGVKEETYPLLLALLDREGLAEPEGDGPNRLTVLSPLAGLDPLDRWDAPALARDIETMAGAVEGLPAKVFVAVDGGGAMPLDPVGADLHLVATADNAVAFGAAAPGRLHWIGTASHTRTPDAACAILSGFTEMRRAGRTEARRLRDLETGLVQALAERASLEPAATPPPRPAAPRAGALPLNYGQVALLALPFGRCTAAQIAQAAAWSERFGHGEIRLSFTRGLLLPEIAEEAMAPLLAEAHRAGFITDAQDPRLSLIACPGKPDCGSAWVPAPADALRMAQSCESLLQQGVILHVSGCAKGCAHPGRADLTLVGRPDRRYDVVPGGSTRDVPILQLSIDDLMTRLLPLKTADDLRRAFADDPR